VQLTYSLQIFTVILKAKQKQPENWKHRKNDKDRNS